MNKEPMGSGAVSGGTRHQQFAELLGISDPQNRNCLLGRDSFVNGSEASDCLAGGRLGCLGVGTVAVVERGVDRTVAL